MPEFAQEESFPVLPIFLLVDVSYSMLQDDAIGAMNRAMPGLKEAIERDPTAGEMARISVITFSDIARTVLPFDMESRSALRKPTAVSGTVPGLQKRAGTPDRDPGTTSLPSCRCHAALRALGPL